MRRQPILIVAAFLAATALFVAVRAVVRAGSPAVLPSASNLSTTPGEPAALPAGPPPVSNYRQLLREHAMQLMSLESLPAEEATRSDVEVIVARAIRNARSESPISPNVAGALTMALTDRLTAMLGGVEAQLTLLDAQIASGERIWQPPEDSNWEEASTFLEYYPGVDPADSTRPRETYARILGLMAEKKNAKLTGMTSDPDGSYVGFRIVRTGDLHGSVLNGSLPRNDPGSARYWLWGGGHSINLTMPARGPSEARAGAPGLLVANCGFVLRTTAGEPITWNSTWYWDEPRGTWSMHNSAAYGAGSARMLN